MRRTDSIADASRDEQLSLELKKLLVTAKLASFKQLATLTVLELIKQVPKLKVRHLVNLKFALKIRSWYFVPDNSIGLDEFINQRKLFGLWEIGIYTYEELDKLTFEEFMKAMGGPQSRFFKNHSAAKAWTARYLTTEKRFKIPYLTQKTAELLYVGGIRSLEEMVDKSDFELAQILQPRFSTRGAKFQPLTKVRLCEIKYALWKSGISRPCMPL